MAYSFKIYPRPDTSYQSKASIDFQVFKSNIYQRFYPRGNKVGLYSWLIFGIIGILMGITAFIVDFLVEHLVLGKWQITQQVMKNSGVWQAWLVFLAISVLFGGLSAILTVYVGPGAMGSGVAELMGYFNGLNIPDLIGIRTLIVKILGTALGVSASLAIGKEGPLAHIGAIIGHMVLYMPFDFLKYFQNEHCKREVAAAGAAAGVSAAFGSPIGGSLFVYEISRPSTFWSFALTWKIFFCSSISTFTLNILMCLTKGKDLSITNAGLIKFGEYDENPYKLQDFPFFIILGIFGGLLGSFFIYVNGELNQIRKKVLKTKTLKVLETVLLTALTATVLFFTPKILSKSCISQDDSSLDAEHIQYQCPDNMYNPMATFLFNPEGTVIKNFLSKKAIFSYETLLLFFLIWFIFTCITYGTFVPAGLFLPGILIGCSLGRVLGLFIENYIVQEIHPSTYAIIGAAATLAGYSRLSFSLAVIMLETTENVNLFLPIIFALFVAFAIGGIFNQSMYVGAVRSKNFPFLNEKVPMCNEIISAEQIMSMPVVTLKFKTTVQAIYSILTQHQFDGFPIVNSQEQCIGLINRFSLIVILKNLDKVYCPRNEALMRTETKVNQEQQKYDPISSISYKTETELTDRIEDDEKNLDKGLGIEESDKKISGIGIGQLNNFSVNINSDTKEVDDDNDIDQIGQISPQYKRSARLDWTDFNVNFRSTTPSIDSDVFKKIAQENSKKVIDLRPFMIPRPFTVFENDSIQKCLDLFRLMNLRHMPVLAEDDGTLVGMITRQDLFAFMSI